jgi:TP901 family phage tail tape measure protein
LANVIHSTLTYNANLSAAQAQIKALTSQIGVLSAAFNTLDKSAMKAQASLASGFMSSVGQIGGFTTQMVRTNTAVETFGQSIAKNRLTMRQYFREAFAGYAKQHSMMKQLAKQQVMMQQSTLVPLGGGRSAVITPTSLDTIANKTALAAQRMSIFNELVQGGSTRLLNFGKNTQWTGRQLMVGFTLPLVLFTALVSKQFRDIDKELTRFEKVYGADLGDSIEGSTKRMREQVKQLAFDIGTSYGIAAKETAALAADIAQTGKEGQELIDSIKQTTRLAVLGEVERQEAMRATLSIQNAFKLNTLELAESIDFLNAVENQTSTNLQDLAGAIPRVGPVIQALNGDIKDMSLLLVAMREGGVAAGEAANALKSGLGRLINPTRAARDMAASFGISLENIIQNSRGELIPMIFALQDSLQGLNDFAKAQVIEKLFGKFQFARMAALFENLRRQGSQTLEVMELASASSTELASIANQELATLQQSSAMRFQRAVESIRNSLIPLGEVLTETMIPILSGIGGAIRSFLDFFSDLPGPIKTFTKFAVTITALAGPVVMLVGLFANLAANGIKAALGLTRLGAMLVGIKTQKFELLTKDVLAASVGVDNLTTSFVEQDAALKKLSQTLGIYGARLQQTLLQNPAFIAGRAGAPIRRQTGSERPEFVPGQGRGDRIPAMLEPGEFVVNRKATEQFAPILMAMNRGTVQGLQEGTAIPGTRRAHITSPLDITAGQLLARDAAMRAAGQKGMTDTARNMLLARDAMGNLVIKSNDVIRVFSNLVLALQNSTNNYLKDGTMRATALAKEMSSSKAWTYVMNMTSMEMQELNPVVSLITKRLMDLGNAVIDDPAMYEIVERSLAELSLKGNAAAQTLQRLSLQYATFADPRVGPTQGHRDRLGISFGPSYKDKAYTPGQRLQTYAPVPMTGAMVNPAVQQAVTKTVEQELGLAQRRVAAAKALETYQTHRQKLLNKLSISERQESLLRDDITRITRDTKIPLAEKLRLQNEINRDIKEEIALRQRINGVLVRLEGNIQAASTRMAALGGPTHLGRGPGGATGYLVGGVSPYAVASTGSGTPLWLKERMKKASDSAPKTLNRGQPIGPQKDGMQMAGPRGQGMMNLAFMSTMLISSFSMMGGASNDLAIKLGILSTAVMSAAMAMTMFSGKNVAGNFLGLGSLGAKMQNAAGIKAARSAVAGTGPAVASSLATKQVGVVAKHAPGGLAPLGGRLATAGSMVSMLGGPVGMAGAAVAVAAVTGFMLYKKAAEEARERAIAAFADPTKTAEYFGASIQDVTQQLKDISAEVPGIESVDENLRLAVKEDYATLIEKIRYGGAEAGGKELGLVFNKMIASGLSAEQAKEAVEAIAVESGTAGGAAYAQAVRQGMLVEKDAADIAKSMADMFNPEQQEASRQAAQQTLDNFEQKVGLFGRVGGTVAQNLDNVAGDFLSGLMSFNANIATTPIQALEFFGGGYTGPGADFIDYITDKDAMQNAVDQLSATERQIHQMQTGIEEMADVTGDSIVKITEVMFENFKKAPAETIEAFRQIQEAGKRSSAIAFDPQPIKDFIAEIDPINGMILNAMIGQDEEIATKVMEAITAGMSISEIIEALERGGTEALEIEVDLKVKEQEIQVELDRLKSELQKDLVLDLDLQIGKEEEQLEGINRQLERMDKLRNRFERQLKKEIGLRRVDIEASDAAVDGMKEQIDSIRDLASARREEFDEKMKQLNEEKDQIEESADAYINSLKRQEKADNFYANQRKTAFSALEKLASGDVFGFLQDRQQMSADAQSFAYESTIQDIEDKRDREVDVIDEVMDKEKERQEKYEKDVEKRIDLIEDQIDAEKDLMNQKQKAFDEEMRKYDRRARERKKDLNAEKREVETSLAQLRTTRDMAEKNVLIDQQRLSKALGEEKAKPYMEEQKAILKTEMMKKYIEMKDKYPDESSSELQMRAHGELIDLFNALYGVTPGQGRRPSMGWAQQLEDIGFTPNFNTGGPVKGPGTPTSDSIPAMLSNGEYVVRASSVSKYGKDMMDTINAGKFANGGIVKARNGTYVSADRAETAASGNKYLGGYKPKPTYSGGTPTSSTGYSTANTQATQTSGYKKKIWSQPKGSPKSNSGGLLGQIVAQGFRQDFSDFISGLAPEGYRNLIGMNLSGDRDYGQRPGWEKSLGSGMFATTALPGFSFGFKALASLARYMPKLAQMIKGSRLFTEDRGSISLLGSGTIGRAPASSGLYDPAGGYQSMVSNYLFKAKRAGDIDPSDADNILHNILPNPGGLTDGVSNAAWSIGADRIERYIKNLDPQHAISEAFLAKAYRALGIPVPNVRLVRVPREVDLGDIKLEGRGEIVRNIADKDSILLASEKLPDFRHVDELDGENNLFRLILHNQGGYGAIADEWFGLEDLHNMNYGVSRGDPVRLDVGENAFFTGAGEPVKPRYYPTMVQRWMGDRVQPTGRWAKTQLRNLMDRLGIPKNPIEHAVDQFSMPLMAQLAKEAGIILPNSSQVSTVLAERLRAIIERHAPELQPPRSVQNFDFLAKGGLVGDIQKFAEGGIVQTRSMSGPNGWPHLTSYNSPLLARKNIPGTQIGLTARKEVLPLFLAIASEYNKRLRKVDPTQSAAFDLRLNRSHDERAKSNHPSGTAMDINWNQEGAYSDSLALFDWWNGRKSPSAPWSSISVRPASEARNIKNRFNRFGEIIEWYGSSKVGGDWIGYKPDWMHWQISQKTKPGPDKVKDITRRLGIDDQGIFDGEDGSTDTEPDGKNKKPPRPRSGANGTGLSGSGMISDFTGSAPGKAVPRLLQRIILPRKGKRGAGGDKPDKPETPDTPDTSGGNYSNRYIRGAQLVKLLHQTGFKGSDLRTAFGVVMGESGGDREAVNNNGTNKDWGLFQMNDYWNRNIVVDGKKADFSPNKIFDAPYNSRFALATTKDAGVISHWKDPWRDWNAYNNNTRWYQAGLKQFDQNPQWRKALGLANGGSVFGPGGPKSDSIPAMLSNGEYVVNSDSVRKYGRGFLDKINSGQLGNSSMMPTGFANGGMVSPSYDIPMNNNISSSQLMNNANNMLVQGGSSTANSNNIKIVINGSGTNAKSVANQVVKMINNATSRRDHSRSIS